MHGASWAVPHSYQDFSWRIGSSNQASNKDCSQFSSLRYIQLVLISYYDLLSSLPRSRFFLGCQKTAVKEITYHYAVFEFREDDRISE